MIKLTQFTHPELRINNEISNAGKSVDNNKGTTTIKKVDVFKLFPVQEKKPEESTEFGKNINYMKGIEDTLKKAGIEYDNSLVNRIYIEIIKANVQGELTSHAKISDVTRLIDINYSNNFPTDILEVETVTKFIDKLLTSPADTKYTPDSEIEQFIINQATEINNK